MGDFALTILTPAIVAERMQCTTRESVDARTIAAELGVSRSYAYEPRIDVGELRLLALELGL